MDIQKDNKFQFLTKRRSLLIQSQKSRRQQIFNKARFISKQTDILIQTHNKQQQQKNQHNQIQNNHSQFQNNKIDLQKSEIKISKNVNKKKRNNKRIQFYKNFQYPQWMIQVPQDLQHYYFSIRPVGQKVIISFNKNILTIISKLGIIQKSFSLQRNNLHGTLLQGYYIKQRELILISDLLIWKANPMSSSQFQFRISWLVSNLSAMLNAIINNINSNRTYQQKINLRLVQYFQFNQQMFQSVYRNIDHLDYAADGILFYHKDSFYLYQVNPNVLIWKDNHVSKSIDKLNNAKNNTHIDILQQNSSPIQIQHKFSKLCFQPNTNIFYAECCSNGLIFTYDNIPLAHLNDIPNNFQIVQACILKLSFSQMCQQSVDIPIQRKQLNWLPNKSQNINFPFRFDNLNILGIYQRNNRISDPISKILFKYNYNKGNMVQLQDIICQNNIKHVQNNTIQMNDQ